MSEADLATEAWHPDSVKPARPQWQFRRPKTQKFDLKSSFILEKNGRRKCWDGKGKTSGNQGYILPSHL